MKSALVGFGWLLAAGAGSLHAQEPGRDEAAVRAVVDLVFEGMREADSAKVRSAFAPGARFAGTRARDGSASFTYDSIDGWLSAIARSNRQWEERLFNTVVQIDADVASMWTEYTFYAAGRLRHCGVDAIDLLRVAGSWRITQFADTQRREGCVPEDSTDYAQITRVVQAFFDAMHARDTVALAGTLTASAVLVNPIQQGDSVTLRLTTPSALNSLVMRTKEPYEERMPHSTITLDGHLAHVWGRYVFRVGSRITNCGANSIQLVRTPSGWKIAHIASTIEVQGCPAE